MPQYILETIIFQLAFLGVYDLFLKKETFFQWNRIYLLGTFILSLVLPWVKIEALATAVPQELAMPPMAVWNLEAVMIGSGEGDSFLRNFPWLFVVLISGSVCMAVWFAIKLYKVQRLRAIGKIYYFPHFVKIVVPNSQVAFSFFRQLFLGGNIKKEDEPQIVAHELVHIKQWHTLDLVFFEVMRIAIWFNPMVYLYQQRMAELHEFIADAKAVKIHKKGHYQALLSQLFQSNGVSFINPFYKSSLIKKRIVMLTKKKSRKILKFRYLMLFPLVLGMMAYTACESNFNDNLNNESSGELNVDSRLKAISKEYNRHMMLIHPPEHSNFNDKGRVEDYFDGTVFKVGDILKLTSSELSLLRELLSTYKNADNHRSLGLFDKNEYLLIFLDNKMTNGRVKGLSTEDFPFAMVEEAPVFPGCENANDKKACFQEKIQRHISKHFRYPQEAQEQGIQGRVSVMFVIDKEGHIIDVRMRGPHELLENEVERIISKLPQMTPGRHQGKTVNVPFSIPITFKLSGN